VKIFIEIHDRETFQLTVAEQNTQGEIRSEHFHILPEQGLVFEMLLTQVDTCLNVLLLREHSVIMDNAEYETTQH
jgi:hypothetical protein